MNTKTKEVRIQEELNRIAAMFDDEKDESKRNMIQPLIERAAFMRILLEDLEEEIRKTGAVEVYQNGANQSGMKQSAAVQAYNSTLKVYSAVIKTLSDKVPYKRPLTYAEQLMKQRAEAQAAEEAKTAEERDAEYEEARQEIIRSRQAAEDYQRRKESGELTPEEQEEECRNEEARQRFQATMNQVWKSKQSVSEESSSEEVISEEANSEESASEEANSEEANSKAAISDEELDEILKNYGLSDEQSSDSEEYDDPFKNFDM